MSDYKNDNVEMGAEKGTWVVVEDKSSSRGKGQRGFTVHCKTNGTADEYKSAKDLGKKQYLLKTSDGKNVHDDKDYNKNQGQVYTDAAQCVINAIGDNNGAWPTSSMEFNSGKGSYKAEPN